MFAVFFTLGAHAADAFRQFNATCASVESGIHRNQWNYRLQLLYQPEFVRIEPELHIEQSLEATAAYKIVVSPGLWYELIQDLFRRFERMHPRKIEDAIYYDCGIEIISPWNQKVVKVYFNRKQNTMKLNGNCFRMEATLDEWWDRNAVPVFRMLETLPSGK